MLYPNYHQLKAQFYFEHYEEGYCAIILMRT